MATESQHRSFYEKQQDGDLFSQPTQYKVKVKPEIARFSECFSFGNEPPGWLNNIKTSRAQAAELAAAEQEDREPRFKFENLMFQAQRDPFPRHPMLLDTINKKRRLIQKLHDKTNEPSYHPLERLGPNKSSFGDAEAQSKPKEKATPLSRPKTKRLQRIMLSARALVEEGIENARRNLESGSSALPYPVAGLETDGSDGRAPLRLMPHQRDGAGRVREMVKTRGGMLLADAMGLGKTLTLIAAVLDRMKEARQIGEEVHFLLVVPPGLIPTWQAELDKAWGIKYKVFTNTLLKTTTRAQLLKFDVVLVPNTVLESIQRALNDCMVHFLAAQEGFEDELLETLDVLQQAQAELRAKPRKPQSKPSLITERIKSALMAVDWEWVVIDEAHSIKRPMNNLALMARTLKANGRIALTGTPVHNSYHDFHAQLLFLGIPPFNDPALFSACFTRSGGQAPTNSAAAAASHHRNALNDSILSAIRSSCTVMRTADQDFDGEPILGAPEPSWVIGLVELGDEHVDIQYEIDHIWDPNIRQDREEAKEAGLKDARYGRGVEPTEVLDKIARAKLHILHPDLLYARHSEYGCDDDGGDGLAGIGVDEVVRGGTRSEEQEATIPTAAREHLKASLDKRLSAETIMARDTKRRKFVSRMEASPDAWESDRTSAVIEAIQHILEARQEKARRATSEEQRKTDLANSKILVFCEYLSALDLIDIGIQKTFGLKPHRFDGTRSQDQRARTVACFEEIGKDFSQPHVEPDESPIMLITSRAGAEGITLVHAGHVLIVGPTWNPYIELQCIARALRKGRLGDVTVHRFFCPESIELRIMDLQKKKIGRVQRALNDEYLLKHADELRALTDKDFLMAIGWTRARSAAMTGRVAGLDDISDDDEDDEDVIMM